MKILVATISLLLLLEISIEQCQHYCVPNSVCTVVDVGAKCMCGTYRDCGPFGTCHTDGTCTCDDAVINSQQVDSQYFAGCWNCLNTSCPPNSYCASPNLCLCGKSYFPFPVESMCVPRGYELNTSSIAPDICYGAVEIAKEWCSNVTYVWGGNLVPDWAHGLLGELDCSGYIHHVYKTIGYPGSVPRYSQAFVDLGVNTNCTLPASDDCWREGDILVLNNPGHVAIYIGEGIFMDSVTPGCRSKYYTDSDTWRITGTVRPALCNVECYTDSHCSNNFTCSGIPDFVCVPPSSSSCFMPWTSKTGRITSILLLLAVILNFINY